MVRLVQGVSFAMRTHPARFETFKQVLFGWASVSLYAKSENMDPMADYGARVMIFQCRRDLTFPDCATCVKTGPNRLVWSLAFVR